VFVPKAMTPFQWHGQLGLDAVRRRQQVLRDAMPRKGVDLSWHDAEVSLLEGALARGGREMSRVIERVWRSGAVFDAWTERFSLARWLDAFAAEGLDAGALASADLDPGAPLPWDHLSAGLSREWLIAERDAALVGRATDDCTFGACSACGVCTSLEASTRLAGGSRG
jgi:hypothetical protein